MYRLNYEEPLYRPPSEADNLILQVTIGCKYNQCSFCSMYKHKSYREKSLKQIQKDIHQAAELSPDTSRVFLADGDAFNLPADTLLGILKLLQSAFPRLTRVSCYATPANIAAKSAKELDSLKANKLSLLYVGLETGHNPLLKKITKGASQQSMINALQHADQAGIKVSATIILGLGGQSLWQQHIDDTATLLNQAPVTYLSTLQLYLDKNSTPEFIDKFGEAFSYQDDAAIIFELKRLIEIIEPAQKLIFRSNHASNALALAGNLPKDRDKLLAVINKVINNPDLLTAAHLRSL